MSYREKKSYTRPSTPKYVVCASGVRHLSLRNCRGKEDKAWPASEE